MSNWQYLLFPTANNECYLQIIHSLLQIHRQRISVHVSFPVLLGSYIECSASFS